jgi:hypothetical protein
MKLGKGYRGDGKPGSGQERCDSRGVEERGKQGEDDLTRFHPLDAGGQSLLEHFRPPGLEGWSAPGVALAGNIRLRKGFKSWQFQLLLCISRTP